MSESPPRTEGSAGPAPVVMMPDSAPEHPPEDSTPPRGRHLSEEENQRYRAVNSLLSSLRL